MKRFFPTIAAALLMLAAVVFVCGAGRSSGPTGQSCDILIVGGGTGGCAAALQACAMAGEWGVTRVVMTEETGWLGGQYTSQGSPIRRQFPRRARPYTEGPRNLLSVLRDTNIIARKRSNRA